MHILITAGNTHAPVDRVRVVTNVFTGKTGADLARTAWTRGHTVTLLTSHPETAADLPSEPDAAGRRLTVVPFATFDDLAGRLQAALRTDPPDAVFHAAAVSDYLCAGVYAPAAGTYFNARVRQWEADGPPGMTEQKGGKIKSHDPELWFRMVRAPKLVDRFRTPWGFAGILVKFKLEVGVTDAELLTLAEAARTRSAADLVVANTLDGARHYAYYGPVGGRYDRVARRELAERVLLAVEHLQRGR